MTIASTMEASIPQSSSCFTKPSVQTFCVMVAGGLPGRGRRTVTRVLPAGEGLKRKTTMGQMIVTVEVIFDYLTPGL